MEPLKVREGTGGWVSSYCNAQKCKGLKRTLWFCLVLEAISHPLLNLRLANPRY